jgi:adenylate kinase
VAHQGTSLLVERFRAIRRLRVPRVSAHSVPSAIGRSEVLARRALAFALDESLSTDAAAEILLRLAAGDAATLELARAQVLSTAATGPVSKRAARALWTALREVAPNGATSKQTRGHLARRRGSTLRLVVTGPPGAGKAAFGQRLAEQLGMAHVVVGDLLRELAAEETPRGFQTQLLINGGHLAPDDLVTEVITARLAQLDARARGFVIDGYPRTIEQATAFDAVLGASSIDAVIELVVPPESAVARLRLRGRDDDSSSAIERRARAYDEEMRPVLQMYEDRGLVWRVDGDPLVDAVTDDLLTHLEATAHRRGRTNRSANRVAACVQPSAPRELNWLRVLIHVGDIGDNVTVLLSGELDVASAPQLGQALSGFTDRHLTIDVTDLEFVDAAGLRVVATAADACAWRGRRFAVYGCSPFMLCLFDICGLGHLVER